MQPVRADILRLVDPTQLGRRIRDARTAAGLTQAALASGVISAPYLSAIESGHRRPDLRVLSALAKRTGATLDEILTGLSSEARQLLRAELDMGEFAMSSQSSNAALDTANKVLTALETTHAPDLARAASRLRAAALEADGDLPAAILELRRSTATPHPDTDWVLDLIALSRCYREDGKLDLAVEVEDENRDALVALGLAGTTEAIQLTITTAGALIFRGDLRVALRTCKRAIADAERFKLPVAQASAMWNASVALNELGHTFEALEYGSLALDIFRSSDDTRNLVRLRTHLANLHLALDESGAEAALALLAEAEVELEWSNAGKVEGARHYLASANAHHVLGHHVEARAALDKSMELAPANAPELRAYQLVLEGRLAVAHGILEAARDNYQAAVASLTAAGADADASQLWVQFGDLLSAAGQVKLAMDAYMRAGASQGYKPL